MYRYFYQVSAKKFVCFSGAILKRHFREHFTAVDLQRTSQIGDVPTFRNVGTENIDGQSKQFGQFAERDAPAAKTQPLHGGITKFSNYYRDVA